MALEVERAQDPFHRGLNLDGRLKLDVALFKAGGTKVLNLIEGQGYEVLQCHPALSGLSKLRLTLGTVVRLSLLGRP